MSEERRILFIIPPYFNINDYIDQSTSITLPAFTSPYGILSIDAYIKKMSKTKVKTELLDLNIDALYAIKGDCKYHPSYFTDIVKNKVRDYMPDIVGISALFNTSLNDLESTSRAVKEQQSTAFVIAGGGLPTNLYSKILEEFSDIDAVCYGEGEIPMADLINSSDYEKLICAHQSWASRETVKARKQMYDSFITDLDEIPIFDFSLINLDDYNARSLDKRYAGNEQKREMSIHTSRGCPFNCVYCSNGKLHGRKVRCMTVGKVMEEVRQMKNEFGVTVLLIEDDHFFSDLERTKTLLGRLSEFDLRIEFPNGLAVYAIDDEIGLLLKKAGVSSVSLAIESGSDYVLKKIINKPLKTSLIKDKAEILKKNDITVHAFIVLGLPGEMDEHRLETQNMLLDVGFDWVHIFIGIPIVGSRLYDICVENGYLIDSDMNNHIISRANIKAPGVDPEKIEEAAYIMNLKVNFVNNWNMSIGNYKKASSYFENVVDKYKDHALGHYYLAKAYEGMGYEMVLIKKHVDAFLSSVENSKKWKRYVNQFGLL
ncbi:MAG: B12-binding domain-containing radical SAM protein [Candidatus Brocadiales bacterium]|nr:B12-binding domain-containing radical SAM protein [Candidatus Brocadiales bacterium]